MKTLSKVQMELNFTNFAKLTVSALIFTLGACAGGASSESAELRALEAEVMEIHDAVMPEMSNINALLKQLEQAEQGGALDSTAVASLNAHKAALVEADSLMWAWMYGYSPPSRDGDPKEIRRYFELEKEKVSIVRDKMLSSIENAESLIRTISHDEE